MLGVGSGLGVGVGGCLDDWLRSGDICGAVVAEASCFSSAALVRGVGWG